ncbi:hypothetical protein H2248_001248 [Termitomyces sp. 'cryptogamus']|nr:hypothetical protein H2248_001248 [Termitomyces sp. 'cryptogamus']
MQQAHNAYVQNKGTLAPGQSILVNKFTVQVERYLSQGGFAHVYLVRTPTPVYNTTHHVLKRIAVANEGMLAEVKKEVDVMRLLKGHPNIVHLIDAAWHKMESGMYEVFILMEYCPGGGIIDMMNRRLRERLTEAEILQIFVDVCEGVACMHNVRPPLLHRDLKVENILQSSPTSYKLCDFGSATTVSRPPATTQEIRTLESDLNRYTTLQYRAPEMIDVYSRRPIDEKSDVWALGVLLYKLCYYTTPFEEHGQLAILNVQYKIPPYPVYSPQMNQLIASMLQEHGVRRPSVFEILDHVHRLRGTKSRFKYSIPAQNPLPLRQQTTFNVSPSSIVRRELSVPRPNRVEMSVSPSRQGVQVREKVMEDIVPLRRGDQVPSKTPETSPSTPNLQPAVEPQFLRRGRPPIRDSTRTELKPGSLKTFGPGKDHPIGGFVTGADSWATSIPLFGNGAPTDAWYIGGDKPRLDNAQEMNIGFGDDFAAKIGDKVVTDKLPSQTHLNTKKLSPSSPTRFQQPLGINKRTSPEKDAFDGLGLLSAEKPEPTLAEARKLRTGLAIMHNNGFRTNPDRPLGMHRPTPSPRLPLSSPLQLYPPSTASLTPNISKALSPSPKLSPHPAPDKGIFLQSDGTPAESRFPSLEELDSGFSVPIPSQLHPTQDGLVSLTRRNGILGRPGVNDVGFLNLDSRLRDYHAREATRSAQVTGAATKDTQGSDSTNLPRSKTPVDSRREEIKPISGSRSRDENDNGSRSDLASKHARPALIDDVNHRLNTTNLLQDADPSSKVHTSSPRLPTRMKPIDWLTGDDDGHTLGVPSSSHLVPPAPDGTPVLRDSPSKRASLILNNEIIVQSAAVAEHDHIERPPLLTTQISSKFTRSFPPIDGFDKLAKEPQARPNLAMKPTPSTSQDSSGSSGDEGPEDAVGIIRPVRKTQTERRGHKGRQNSVHDLVDLYGGGLSQKDKERETPTARPLNLDPGSNTQSQKHHSIAPPKPTKPQSSSLSAVSNTSLPSHSTSTAVSGRSPSNEQRTTSTSGPSSSPSRPRPQSMFIFPSKSVDSFPLSSSQPLPSPELAPPEDIKHRDVRRTSISDIVQHYEDISGAIKLTGPVNTTSPTAAVVKVPLAGLAENDVLPPKPPLKSEKERAKSSVSLPVGDYVSSRRPKSPTESNILPTVPITSRPIPIRHPTESNLASATPVHGRPVAIRHNTLNKGSDVIPPSTPLNSEAVRVTKFPTSSTTDGSLSHAERVSSSSPERPYQGVSKLIDQWQKKTAEAESSRTVRGRGTFTAKQSKIVPDSSV